MPKINCKNLLSLHFLLFIYSLGALCSKLAAEKPFLSAAFVGLYISLLLILFIYAVFWQQLLKKIPLTTAFANRAAVVVWSMVWGRLFFSEKITWQMIAAVFLIFIGITTVVSEKNE